VHEFTVGQALGAGFRAAAGEIWLVGLGMAVTLTRGLLALPAVAFLTALSWLTVVGAVGRGGGVDEVAMSLARIGLSIRARSILLGLWLAGLLLWGALRVAWVSGAMPLLAWRLAGRRGEPPTFAAGAAWRFHRVLPVAVASLLLGLAGQLMLLAGIVGAVAIAGPAQVSSSPGVVAFVTAGAGIAALVIATSLSVLGDVAVARAAMAGEGPGRAMARAARSFLARPAAFLVAVLAVWLATTLAVGSVQGFLGALAGTLRGGPRALLVFPEMALAAVAALLASAAEMWRLSAVGALALGGQPEGQPEREPRRMSFRTESLGILPPSQ
jgi:hypothetical protein